MEHQMYVLGRSMDEKAFALFMETGTGKTITAIENAKYLWNTNKINFMIVLAPKLVCESVWEPELERYRKDMDFRVFKWIGGISSIDKYVMTHVIKAISEERQYANILPIFIVNIESLSYTKVYNTLHSIINKAKTMVIVDESTTIKNPKAARTKSLLRLSDRMTYKRILSGYPILRSPEDLYTQIRFLGKDLMPYSSFYAFRNDFCNLRNMGRHDMVLSYKNLGRLAHLIERFSVRITKKECLDLPDKVRTKRYVDMTDEQNNLYQSMKTNGFLELESCEAPMFASTFLAQLSKLHQIANGIILDHGIARLIEHRKLDALMDILNSEIPDQVTIWFWFTETLRQAEARIQKKFGRESTAVIYGQVGFGTRTDNLLNFQHGHARFLLANPATAMHGLNLTNCSYVIYYNNSTHLEHRIQSEDRFHRIGQTNKVTYIDLITHNTVEDKILAQLQKNHKIGAEVLKDTWKEWFT